MGEGLTGNGAKTVEELIAEAKRKQGRGNTKIKGDSKGSDTANSSTETGGAKTRPTDGITILGAEGKKEVLGLAPVEAPTPRKKRESTKKTAKKASVEEGAVMIGVFIKTVSDLTAIRPGMEIWSLSQPEAKAIADPLASIFDRYNLLDKMGEYGDIMALTLALSVAFVPRVMITAQIQKGRRVKTNGIPVHAPVPKREQPTGTGNTEKPAATTDTRNDGQVNPNGGVTTNGSHALKQLLPAIM